MASLAPAAAKRRALYRPMPIAPPVMMTTLSATATTSLLVHSVYSSGRNQLALVFLFVSEGVVAVGVGLLRHQAGEVALGELGLELLSDVRVFVRVLNLIVLVLDALALAGAARGVEGEVAGGRLAYVEVLVEPAVRRDEHAALVPRDGRPARRPRAT